MPLECLLLSIQARNDPRNNLAYIYLPGATSPFDDPLVRLIRQMSTYSGNLRSRDTFLERARGTLSIPKAPS